MADLSKARETQLRNIQDRTGRSLDELGDMLASSGLTKHGERRSFLMQELGLGHGDANTLVHVLTQPERPATPADPLDAIYVGAKADLRSIHENLVDRLRAFGAFEEAPKKAYVSLRRRKQFATIGPATRTLIEVGINASDLPPSPRLKTMPPASMCRYSVRIGTDGEIDDELLDWIRAAFEAAG